MARESVVLLKNDGVLPLSKKLRKIAVIGPHADSKRLMFAAYSYTASVEMLMRDKLYEMPGLAAEENVPPTVAQQFSGSRVQKGDPRLDIFIDRLYGGTKTILEAIRDKCPSADIVYARGCDYAGDDRSGFCEAVEAAKGADAVILAMGGKCGWGKTNTVGEGTDSADIGLTGVQEELAREIFKAQPKNLVFVHMDGRPLSSGFIAESFSAALEYFYPGDTGGAALADVLFGDYNPAGRLPVSALRDTGRIPLYTSRRRGDGADGNQTPSRYLDADDDFLYVFGHGLSYTRFEYSNLSITEHVAANGELSLSFDVSNTGTSDGDEIAQIYVSDELACMLRPQKELAGFRRVFIKAGETVRLTFQLRADQFAFLNSSNEWIVEAGEMTVQIGASSGDIRLKGGFTIDGCAVIDTQKRGFYATESAAEHVNLNNELHSPCC